MEPDAEASPDDSPSEPTAIPGGPLVKKWGRMSADDESSLPRLDSVSDDGLRPNAADKRKMLDSPSDEYYPLVVYTDCRASPRHKLLKRSPGEGPPTELPSSMAGQCPLNALPAELLHNILSYLSPVDLALVSQTCRDLHRHASSEHIWQAIVQSNVPGVTVSSPHPCSSFRELYLAHDPRWFLPKYKLWFCGRDLTGKLIIVRYDQQRGCIEGYQMLAISNRTTFQYWQADDHVVIHAFEPEVKLHLDKPVLRLQARTPENIRQDEMRRLSPVSIPPLGDSGSRKRRCKERQADRFSTEIPMDLNDASPDTMFRNFMLARPARGEAKPAIQTFPYGNIWPPPAIPARHRIYGQSFFRDTSVRQPELERPTKQAEVSDQAFHIRSWMEMRPGFIRVEFPSPRTPSSGGSEEQTGVESGIHSSVQGQASRPWPYSPGLSAALGIGQHIGEEITTYATLDPKLYTPTADKPWRGIWVGDYSGHGCEFLLINQPDDEADEGESTPERRPDETAAEYEQRKKDGRVFRGQLEAIKLTGDPNVPRGEYTFVADDLGEKGFVTIVQEPPFVGARVVKSKGHVAGAGFRADKYIESQLLLISHDRLAQYWVGFGHISFFERVDIDKFLEP